MSGIVAIVHFDGVPVSRRLIDELIDSMSFRGPDGRRARYDDEPERGRISAALGHTALHSTFESENEIQPMTLDGQVWITADARVDGRTELVDALRTAGSSPANAAPDAELILHAYGLWGEHCVERLIGDFAFIVWDHARQRLFCARDRFGVVPFYYARLRGGLVCSNTLRSIRRHPDVSDDLNEQALFDHLIFGGNQDWDTTNYSDIQRLPPGHTLTASDGNLSIRRYADLADDELPLRYRHAADYVAHFRQLFDRATADRLRTNRAGILMSGGLDSTSVAASAKHVLDKTGAPYDLRAYTWIYTRLLPDDERRYSAMAAQRLGIPVQFLEADEPTVDPLAGSQNGRRSPLQLVSEFGRVMLSGLGGDPALYPDRQYWVRLLGRGHLGRLCGDLAQHVRFCGRLPPFYLRPNVGRWLGRPVWRPPYPTWLRADAATRLGLQDRLAQITDERLSDRGRTGMISPFWSNLLANRDPDHTGVPVKMRHPFFDLRLIRYLMRIPAVPWFVDKRLLRESVTDALPDAVRLRPKTLLASWPHHAMVMKEGVPAWMEDLAQTPELRRYVDVDALRRALHSPAQMADYEYQAAVRALTLAVWLRREGLSAAGGVAPGQ